MIVPEISHQKKEAQLEKSTDESDVSTEEDDFSDCF